MSNETILTKLLNNTPIALILIGIFLFLTGAAGGWPKLSLVVNELSWRIALATMGGIVAGIGSYQILRGSKSEPDTSCKEYDIRITSTQPGQLIVRGDIDVYGTYKKWPAGKSVRLFVIDRRNQYWVQTPTIRRNEKEKSWHSQVHIGGSADTHAIIMIAIVGEAGQALCEYYRRVKEVVKEPIGITGVPSDVTECDSVKILKK
jgi:hypothetical protein